MISLSDFLNSSSACFIDAATGQKSFVKELLQKPLPGERAVIILYLDAEMESLSYLLSALDSRHVVLLMDSSLNEQKKQKLAELYRPSFVFDASKEEGEREIFYDRDSDIKLHTEIKLLLSTSGSTGSPKMVKLSESNLISNADSIVDFLPIEAEDVTPLNMPLHYSYGLSILTTHILRNATMIVNPGDLLSRKFWDHFQKYAFTSLAGVPFFYDLLKKLRFPKQEHSSLRYMSQAGGGMSKELILHFNEKLTEIGAKLYVMYGQTEATARIAYLDPNKLPDKAGSIGKAIKAGELRLNPENGEILYRGPNVHGGYASHSNDLEKYEKEEWLRTGDLGYTDKDGFYYISGRLKRIAKLFGLRLSLDSLERELYEEFKTQFFVLERGGDTLVILSERADLLEEARSYLSGSINILPRFISTHAINHIPLLDTGKVDRKALISQYGSK